MGLYWRYSHTGMSYWGNSTVILNILECHSENIVIVNILHCWRYWLPYWNYCHIERTGMSCWTHCHVEDNVMWKNTVMLKLQLCWRYRILKFFHIECTVILKILSCWRHLRIEITVLLKILPLNLALFIWHVRGVSQAVTVCGNRSLWWCILSSYRI